MVEVDPKTGDARQVLVGDRSTFADPNQHLMFGDEIALRPDDAMMAAQADGIALSPDAHWLYYRPLTDHNYWRVPPEAVPFLSKATGRMAMMRTTPSNAKLSA